MFVIKKSWLKILPFLTRTYGRAFRVLWFATIVLLLSTATGRAQQLLTFNVGGKSYTAEVLWTVKHNNTEYKAKTEHPLDLAKAGTFDLAVLFKFKNDSIPPDGNIVWGFQFSESGNLFTPPGGEKRSRSKSQFQRFNFTGTGHCVMTIIPKVWQKTGAGRFDMIRQGNPFTLGFDFSNSNLLPAPEVAGPAGTPDAASETPIPANTTPAVAPAAETPQNSKVEIDYTAATTISDTIQRTRALIDFVEKYSATAPKSELVARAVKDIPLSISLPSSKKEGTYTYTLDYPVNLVIDSSKVKGWSWNLSKTQTGKYELVLTDLKDSVHAFTLTDLGKNAPFNLPKELSPFEKIKVELLGQSSDSFRLRVIGGVPPFIVFLSQNGFPVERYVIENTNTIQAFSKADCERCETGAYTLEVYSSDFSTLLLRVEKVVKIRRINYLLVLLFCTVGIPVFFYGFKFLRRLWQWLVYQKTLRDIHVWEQREIREAERRKKG